MNFMICIPLDCELCILNWIKRNALKQQFFVQLAWLNETELSKLILEWHSGFDFILKKLAEISQFTGHVTPSMAESSHIFVVLQSDAASFLKDSLHPAEQKQLKMLLAVVEVASLEIIPETSLLTWGVVAGSGIHAYDPPHHNHIALLLLWMQELSTFLPLVDHNGYEFILLSAC